MVIQLDALGVKLLQPTYKRGMYTARAPWREIVQFPLDLKPLELIDTVVSGNTPVVTAAEARFGQAGELHLKVTLGALSTNLPEIPVSQILTNSYRDGEIGR